MKQLMVAILLLTTGARIYAQQEKRYVHNGNKLYEQKKYAEAEAAYRKSVEKKGPDVAGNFNLGDALYKQKKFTEAGQKFTELASSGNNKTVLSKAYHNLGNSLLENKKLEESVEAYKKALLNNPADDETRYNLAYAQEKLKQQQKQDKKNQDKKDQDKKDQDKKDQDKKDQKDQDKQNQDKKDKDKKDQQKGQKPQPDKLSKDDAERMLNALNNDEKQTQEKLKNKKLKGVKMHISKDW